MWVTSTGGSSSPSSSAASWSSASGATSSSSSASSPSRSCRSCRAGSRCSFGSERSAPELQRGLELGGFTLSGKIDRIDVDPFSARGIVQDYKSGVSAHSAAADRLRAEAADPALHARPARPRRHRAARRALPAARRRAEGARAAACGGEEDGLPGFSARDYLDEEAFWGVVDRAQDHARGFVATDPLRRRQARPEGGGPCPTWCELWSICRVKRA